MIDPSIYVYRFCSELEFGDEKFKKVKDTAIRLIQSMNRSWMSTGRRPNGLCAAAILVAAKIHGFKRTTAQSVQVVRVSENTIRNRLNEFQTTNTAQLKLEEF